MTTKGLTGWLLIVGPILTFLVVGILYTALVGEGETNLQAVEEAMAKIQTARLLGVIGTIVFASTFVGMTLLARSMQGPYAAVAGLLFTAITGLSILASGLGLGAMDTAQNEALNNPIADAATIGLVGDGIWASLFLFWGVANLLVGAAIVIQKNLHVVLGYLFIAWGVLFVLVSIIESVDIPDGVGLVIWLLLNLTMVATGVITVLEDKKAS